MKLTYNLLWIDDRQKRVEGAQDRVREKLARLGFELNLSKIERVENEAQLRGCLVNNDFDLLVVDFKMQQGQQDGSELIKIIRRYCTATDIAFYSSETPKELRTKIDVDGVYCYNRNFLPNDLMHLIDTRLKKLLDLNQMRGLYLAAVADFDHLIDELIHSTFDLMEAGCRPSKVTFIMDSLINFHEKKLNEVKELQKDLHIDQYTKLLSSDPKVKLLIKILSELNNEQLFAHIDSLGNYTNDIIVPRNQLAHAMEVNGKAGIYSLKNQLKEFEFNLDDFLRLRHKVLDYKDTFDNIKFIAK